jgi:perosamine synthetase
MNESPGSPFLPYGRQWISDNDVKSVVEILKSDWITTGPKVNEFELGIAKKCSVKHGVAVSNGTTALHAAYSAIGVGPGDEVIIPAITFAATANMVAMNGAIPVFADVDRETLLIDPESVSELISDKTKAVVGVDYAGQPFDYLAIREIAESKGISVISDAAHSLGGSMDGSSVGSLADITTFSFHPVKSITTGEGGMVVTDDDDLAKKVREFRNHGIDATFRQREERNTFEYDVSTLGSNYRITDIQCGLGISQLSRLEEWVERRNRIADLYDEMIYSVDGVNPLGRVDGAISAFHLYVVRIERNLFGKGRDELFHSMRELGIGVNVHYRPVHLFSYYQRKFGTSKGSCPVAEEAYEEILSLPIFPKMDDRDVSRVVEALRR